jgi:hypothetical protein
MHRLNDILAQYSSTSHATTATTRVDDVISGPYSGTVAANFPRCSCGHHSIRLSARSSTRSSTRLIAGLWHLPNVVHGVSASKQYLWFLCLGPTIHHFRAHLLPYGQLARAGKVTAGVHGAAQARRLLCRRRASACLMRRRIETWPQLACVRTCGGESRAGYNRAACFQVSTGSLLARSFGRLAHF